MFECLQIVYTHFGVPVLKYISLWYPADAGI